MPLTIGTLSKRTGCNIETIRYYERIALLPPPPRSPGGHRQYDDWHLKRLSFVRRGRELGFTLEEIRALLNLVDGGDFTCDEVRSFTLKHADDISLKVADLKRMETVLRVMAADCDRGDLPDCPIVETLFRER